MPEYVRGLMANLRGPRQTVTDPDPIAVERLVSGVSGDRPLVLAKVERDAAIDLLDSRRWSSRDIAQRLGFTQRTVVRRRHHRRRLSLLGQVLRERFGTVAQLEREAAETQVAQLVFSELGHHTPNDHHAASGRALLGAHRTTADRQKSREASVCPPMG